MSDLIDPLTYHEEVIRAAHARVVNVHHETPYDVYIGRSRSGEPPNVWANPYALDERGREVCILRYLEHVQRTKLYQRAHELKGLRLGCFCSPLACHGHILAELALEPHAKAAEQALQRLIRARVEAWVSKPLVTAVSGSRRLTSRIDAKSTIKQLESYEQDYTEVKEALTRAPWQIAQLHHGACEGVDELAADIMRASEPVSHPAEWGAYGDSAGPRRNAQMLAQVEAFVALWDGKLAKSGTLQFVKMAWDSPDWLCWAVPSQGDRIRTRFYGVRI